jgi:hypothetical protein
MAGSIRAFPGEVETGSPSGNATKNKELEQLLDSMKIETALAEVGDEINAAVAVVYSR